MKYSPKMMILCLIFFIIQTAFLTAAENDSHFDEMAAAFKSGDYARTIALFEAAGPTDSESRLLAAASYSRIGSIEARRLYKTVYKKDRTLGLFAAYMLAKSYEQSGEYREVVHLYKVILSQLKRKRHNFDAVVLRNAVLTRLYDIQDLYVPAGKTLSSASRTYTYALCLKALSLQRHGETAEAADIFRGILTDTENPCRIFVLQHIAEDHRVVTALLDETLSPVELIRLYQSFGLHDEAIDVSYVVPEGKHVLFLRAESFIQKKMYDPAISLLLQMYEKNGDSNVLFRLSSAYFKAGDTGTAQKYLDLYVRTVGTENLPADAAYFMFKVRRMPIEPYLNAVSKFIDSYREYPGLDALVYHAFYYTLSVSGEDRALEFLKKHIHDLVRPNYRGWAHYLLGIYGAPDYFKDTVLEYPGSYYFFKASAHLTTHGIEHRDIDRADALADSQKRIEDGDYSTALQTLVHLYSLGLQPEDTRDRIQKILETNAGGNGKYSIAYLNSGVFFRVFRLGLYDELLEILENTYPVADKAMRYKLSYLFSRIYYARGDVYRGIAYARRMAEYINRDYTIFLDDDIRRLLYPVAYEDIIAKVVEPDEAINRNFLLAVIREESRFKPDALSTKGAAGLMQLMPKTAGWIIHRSVTRQDLFNPELNITAGTAYLRYLFKRFGSMEKVLAAYNGGPRNATRWSQRDNNVDKMVERIPYSETRDFIKKVFTSYKLYETIYGKND